MNLTILPGNASLVTMNSQEIADLVESRHDSVKLCIERLALRGAIQLPPLAEVKNHLGQTVSVYQVSKRDSYIVVAQLSPEFTARLVDRWQTLEAEKAAPAVLTTIDILTLAMESEKGRLAAVAQLAIAAPKAAFVDHYVESTGLRGFRQVAKLLKANEARLRDFLTEKKIMYRLGGEWAAYQAHIDAGRFDVKAGANQVNQHAFTTTLFTPKGIEWLAGLWAVHGLSGEVAA